MPCVTGSLSFLTRLFNFGGRCFQVTVRTSEGMETRDSYVEKRSTPMIRIQPNASAAAAAAASNSTMPPARSYWTTQASSAGRGGGGPAEPDVRRSSSTTPKQSTLPPIVMQAVIGVNFIADHLKQQDEFNKVDLRWRQRVDNIRDIPSKLFQTIRETRLPNFFAALLSI